MSESKDKIVIPTGGESITMDQLIAHENGFDIKYDAANETINVFAESKDNLINKLRKALEFYAEERHFKKDNHPLINSKLQVHLPTGYGIILDTGEVARKALEE
jgi:hypothetical protein